MLIPEGEITSTFQVFRRPMNLMAVERWIQINKIHASIIHSAAKNGEIVPEVKLIH